jgi:hypothetical protein
MGELRIGCDEAVVRLPHIFRDYGDGALPGEKLAPRNRHF